MNFFKQLFSQNKTTKQCDVHVVKKSFPLIEGKTKSNVKKYTGLGRQAPPPPPPPIRMSDLSQNSTSSVTLLEKVKRVEVIDQNGRSYVNWMPDNKVEITFQNEGRTLKVFISNYL